ncbi:MAG TPA: Fe-S cluster assembly protein SufD [Dokdonella sp.]
MNAALLDSYGSGDAREREESWRYSKAALRALSQQAFVDADAQATLSAPLRAQFEWPQTAGRRLVFVNGAYSPAYSDLSRLGDALTVAHAADQRLLLTIAAAFAGPVHLVYANVPTTQPSRWQATSELHVLGGSASIIEQHVGEAGADVLGALVSDIHVSARANVQMITLSDLPDSTSLYRRTQAAIADAAAYATTHAILGGRLQRFDIGAGLAGAQSRFDSHGVFALRGRQHADVHLDVRHVARDTACDIVWRGVADQRSRGIFHGAITVAAGADGADAQLSNKNLLLSPHAEIDTQPVLEIYADEVKAAHGATVGQLDEHALFYLRSRGLPLEAARSLLIGAFCRSVFAGLAQADLRERIEALLDQRIPSGGVDA